MMFDMPTRPAITFRALVNDPARSPAANYGAALLAVALALIIELAFYDFFSDVPYFLFWAALGFSAWFGGFGPGMISALLSALLISYFFHRPAGSGFSLQAAHLLQGAIFIGIGFVLSLSLYIRRRAEAQVEWQRAWLYTTLASIGDGVIASDEKGRITFMNGMAEALTGWPASEVMGQPVERVFRIVAEDTRTTQEIPIIEALQHGVIVGLANHTILISRDGTERSISDTGAPILDSKGRVRGAVLVFQDVSEQRVAEQALEKSEALYRAFVANSTEGICLLELEEPLPVNLSIAQQIDHLYRHAYLSQCNDTSARLFGRQSAREMTGLRFNEYLPRDVVANLAHLNAFLTNGYRTAAFETEAPGPDGGMVYLETHFVGIIEGGMLRRVWTIQRDVTERKRLEQQRQAVLEQERAARLRAEEADRLKLQFLAMISHELRTPLTSIKGFATTLLADDVEWEAERQAEFITIIDQEADKLTDLVEQLLDLSRLQSGIMRIAAIACPLESAVRAAQSILESQTRQHTLTIDLPDALPEVVIDVQRIAQVLTNLVGNAAKFSATGSPIRVSAASENGFVKVSVSDQGIGVRPEDQERIFEAFRQIDRKEGTGQVGAGLGLAICKGLVEAHGGRIWIEPRAPGQPQGTTVHFTLPVAL
jgi:PAS domain S-box-containing protein